MERWDIVAGRQGIPNDPDRREKIIAAALEVIVERGVAGIRHRSVAEKAEVPLGSMTYHFKDRAEVIVAAFKLLVTTMSRRYGGALASARNREEACDALTDLVCGDSYATGDQMVAQFEMYTYARQNPAVAEMSLAWMRDSRAHLSRHFSIETAQTLDAFIEGWTIHRFIEGTVPDRCAVRNAIDALAAHSN